MHIDEIRIFDNYTIIEMEKGNVHVQTEVTKTALNLYGNAHGGYLFTLADQISGMTALSAGATAVTLQANINYLKAGQLGDSLAIRGHIVHNGRTTKVVETSITNQNQEILAKGTFTMFVTGTA